MSCFRAGEGRVGQGREEGFLRGPGGGLDALVMVENPNGGGHRAFRFKGRPDVDDAGASSLDSVLEPAVPPDQASRRILHLFEIQVADFVEVVPKPGSRDGCQALQAFLHSHHGILALGRGLLDGIVPELGDVLDLKAP
jgi:hypothetical protein